MGRVVEGAIFRLQKSRKFQKNSKILQKMDFLKHLPINGNETEQLWNNLSDTSGFLAGDKPNGGDFIND